MLHDIVKKGSTDRSVTVRIIDSTDGTPETGVVYNTSGIDLWYRREGAAKTSITEATLSALTDAHSDGGFLHVGDGVYRLDLPDAAFATGANYVDYGGTVTGMVVIGGRVRLVDFDLESATVVAASVTGAVGSVTGNVGGNVVGSVGSVSGAVGSVTGNVGGNVAGSVASVTGAVGSVTGAVGSVTGNVGGNVVGTVAGVTPAAAGAQMDLVNAPNATAVTAIQNGLATSSALSTVGTNVSTLLTRIPAALFSGITSLAQWLGLLAGKQTGDSTARTEIRATGAGSGTFDETTDSGEARADAGNTLSGSVATAAALATAQSGISAIKVITDALTAAAAAKLALSAPGIVSGSVVTGTLSTTQATTNLTEATDDHYNGGVLVWTSGVLAGQRTDITDYTGATKLLTYTACTEAPSNGDTFVIL